MRRCRSGGRSRDWPTDMAACMSAMKIAIRDWRQVG
jgi:hypothetical protein